MTRRAVLHGATMSVMEIEGERGAMRNKISTSRFMIMFTVTALCLSKRAAAGGTEISLSEAFGSMQATVQAGKVFVTPGLGSWVMDKDDRIGQVVAVYPDGNVGYQVGDTGYISNDLSPELEYGDGVWTGDTVIDTDNEVGTVMRIFCTRNPRALRDPACRIQYKVRNSFYIAKGGLKREVQEYVKSDFPHLGRKVSRGSTIITPENKTFTVDQVFSDGRVRFRVGAKTEVLTRDRYTVVLY